MQQNLAKNEGFLPRENEHSRQWILLRNDSDHGVYAYAREVGLSRSMVNFIDPSGLIKGELTNLPKTFRNWLHRQKQLENRKVDYAPDEVKEMYELWKKQGMPTADAKGKYRSQRRSKFGKWEDLCVTLDIAITVIDVLDTWYRAAENDMTYEEQIEADYNDDPYIYMPGDVLPNPFYKPEMQ